MYFSEKFSEKIWVILGNANVSIFKLVEKLYTVKSHLLQGHAYVSKDYFGIQQQTDNICCIKIATNIQQMTNRNLVTNICL